ncbi:ABC1 kinase family protein [Sphingomonas crocodyli]|uniref:AarF/ABC1/UbiB kinase family protein n=1 Tax=Sphingomonas crocodyli TaxID=1979270 RepID=A0A437LY95_9SPHN|nr:AarF/UbiB family protein [Sphingomonas crocodyli]RVT90398.1 AarF/ABC1/UbiB kinase family protein [Sphingomonas crocodyli]
MLPTAIVIARDRARLRQIAKVATRFGLGLLVDRLGLTATFQAAQGPVDGLPERTRRALEALGPTFVKLGQILATRRDLLPPEWIEALEHLHSRAPTIAFDQLRPAVEAALGDAPEAIFASFDPMPLAAASIAQVHRATLHDGAEVVLKFGRPGARAKIEADLRLITHLAAMAERASAEMRRLSPSLLVAQLSRDILEELDFTNEGRNADRLRDDFADDPRVTIPRIHWPLTSSGLLVMEFIDGVAPVDGETLRDAGLDPRAIADLGADVVLDMLLLHGRFHGDPHPGNLLCLPGNRLALLDLGSVGQISARRRSEFLSFVQALIAGDAPMVADTLRLWSGPDSPDHLVVERAAERIIARHGGGPLVLSRLVGDLFPLLREEGLVLPPDLLLVFKALITIDGVLASIAPGFDLSEPIRRARSRILMSRLSPPRARDPAGMLLEIDRLAASSPRLLRAVIRRIEAEPLPSDGLRRIEKVISAGARWVGIAILIAGAAIAGALLV